MGAAENSPGAAVAEGSIAYDRDLLYSKSGQPIVAAAGLQPALA